MKSNPPPYDASYFSSPPPHAQTVGGVTPPNVQIQHTFYPGPDILTTVIPVGPHSTHMVCPHCKVEINTSTKSEPGIMAYVIGTVLCLIGCIAGCCLIPCCMDTFKEVHHKCPNCNAYLGKFRR